MIDLYYWTTPKTVHKITMFLEDWAEVQDFSGEYRQGRSVRAEFFWRSRRTTGFRRCSITSRGQQQHDLDLQVRAMLLYLAEKTGQFLPADLHGHHDVIQWTFWQMGGLGPMADRTITSATMAGRNSVRDRSLREQERHRLYGVLDERLSDREFIGGQYSIADMACYPWVVPQEPGSGHRTVSASQATAFDHRRAAGHGARLCAGQGRQPELRTARDPHRGRRKLLFGQTAAVVK